MKHKLYIYSIALLMSLSLMPVRAQYTNTLYFMEEISDRNLLNPAFTPNCKSYFDFIFLPNLFFSAGSNNLTLSDFVFNRNGQTQSLLSSNYTGSQFYENLPRTSRIDVNTQINILNFGWSTRRQNFYSIGFNVRASVNGYLPRDLLRLALEGTPEENAVNHYNLKHLGVQANVYSEVSFGYSRILNEQWTVGARAKFLMGYANINTHVDDLSLDASRQIWTIKSNARIEGSVPVDIARDENGEYIMDSVSALPTSSYIELLYNPSGFGGAIDIGVTYKPIENLTISAAITDLGFIRWNRYLHKGTITGTHSFEGVYTGDLSDVIAEEEAGSEEESKSAIEEFGDELLASTNFTTGTAYSQMLMANAVVGVEYGILNNKISFGALSRTQFNASQIFEEVTVSANFRPANWFKATVDYTLFNGGWGTIGLGLNLRLGAMNMYLLTDYIPVNYALVTLDDATMPIPYRMSRANVQMGIAFNLGSFSRDLDHDGVRNRRDQCADTDFDFFRTQCPETKRKKLINKEGCIYDQDGDGVHDCYDQCANTPLGAQVDSVGCPIDSDHDGVIDFYDECADTPQDVKVDTKGCPLDMDGDGIPDYLDDCPSTSSEAYGQVDLHGCPKDDDHDGVPNYKDLCPNTPDGIKVNQSGCPHDGDGDGVPDYLDQCPDTPTDAIGYTDQKGCPKDDDNDGVPNYLDHCPNSAANATVDKDGCEMEITVSNKK